MSAKTIALYQAHLAAQGRAPRAPVDIRGTRPYAVAPVAAPKAVAKKVHPDIATIPAMRTADIWTLAEESLLKAHWATARAALDELGLRLDSAYERLQHHGRGCQVMPELGVLTRADELPSCYRPIIGERITWVNNLVAKAKAGR